MPSNKVNEDQIVENQKTRFFNEIKKYIIQKYEPAKSARQPGILFLSTEEVYNKIYFLFPSKLYEPETIALWLNELGFQYIDMGNIHFEWMFKIKGYRYIKRK